MGSKIFVAVAVLVAGLIVVVAMQPGEFHVERTATISAPAAAVFAQVNDFHNWAAWSPWERLDPAMKKSYEGAPSGTGAVYAWSGNREVGEGRTTILESRPNEFIRMQLEFVRPLACTNTVEFTFSPEGDRMAVTWTLFGRNNFVAKGMGLIMDMDKMVGGQFEQGLAQMKSVTELASAQ